MSRADRTKNSYIRSILIIFVVAAAFTVALATKSLVDFSRSGPPIRDEILKNYALYGVYAVGRLTAWAFVISALFCGIGVISYGCLGVAFRWQFRSGWAAGAAVGSLGGLTFFQFASHLLYRPSSLVASSHYDNTRFYLLWEQLTPDRLQAVQWGMLLVCALLVVLCSWRLIIGKRWAQLLALVGGVVTVVSIFVWASWSPEPISRPLAAPRDLTMPNFLLLGSDNLRADRLGISGYGRELTPFLNGYAEKGTYFANAYVPLARTAPTVTSLLTGTWPHHHGVRSNYTPDKATILKVPSLPRLLSEAGYRTVALGDWAFGDAGKFNFGFDEVDVAPDQWNLKFLMRQGPKDLRLFLSLFTHNRFGKKFLPEIYYLAGVPLTSHMGRQARALLNRLGVEHQPFFLNVFISTTHGPFGSEYPYYTLFSAKDYRGDSKFAMAGLNDPVSVIQRQEQDESSFDVQQIIDLYDGAVRQFDDELRRIIEHLEALGLDKNTIVVIYSDHGMDLFERQGWGQGNSVIGDDPSARVPLLIVDPRRKGGRVISNVVRAVDLAPTLLQLVDLEPLDEMDGVSLVPYLDEPDVDLDLSAFHETGVWLGNVPTLQQDHLKYPSLLEMLEIRDKKTGTLSLTPEYERIVIQAKDRMIRKERWKLVYLPMKDGAVYWLFDVVEDPECITDVYAKYPEIAENLKNELVSWMSQDPLFGWDGKRLVPKSDGVHIR